MGSLVARLVEQRCRAVEVVAHDLDRRHWLMLPGVHSRMPARSIQAPTPLSRYTSAGTESRGTGQRTRRAISQMRPARVAFARCQREWPAGGAPAVPAPRTMTPAVRPSQLPARIARIPSGRRDADPRAGQRWARRARQRPARRLASPPHGRKVHPLRARCLRLSRNPTRNRVLLLRSACAAH